MKMLTDLLCFVFVFNAAGCCTKIVHMQQENTLPPITMHWTEQEEQLNITLSNVGAKTIWVEIPQFGIEYSMEYIVDGSVRTASSDISLSTYGGVLKPLAASPNPRRQTVASDMYVTIPKPSGGSDRMKAFELRVRYVTFNDLRRSRSMMELEDRLHANEVVMSGRKYEISD